MKQNFTLKSVFTLVMVCGLFAFANAQVVNTLTVTGSSTDYTILIGVFGPQPTSMTGGALVLGDDGDTTDFDPMNPDPGTTTDACQPSLSNVSGKFAMIDRGDCGFEFKTHNAEAAGALAVIICNDEDTGLVNMGGDDMVDDPTIAAFSMSMEDCATIKMDLANGEVNIAFKVECNSPAYGPDVIWGQNPGEGDFDGGMHDWTVEPAVACAWRAAPVMTGWNGLTADTNTDCNGVVEFVFGNCAGGEVSELISPVIDLSGQDLSSNGLVLEFDQFYLNWRTAEIPILLSKNGGVSWPDTIMINRSGQDTWGNNFPIPSNNSVVNSLGGWGNTVRVPLCTYGAGTQSLRFKIQHTADQYYWMVDDFRLYLNDASDIQIHEPFFATAPSYRTPVTQVSGMPFVADITNVGTGTATNAELNIAILDGAGNELYSASRSYADIGCYETVFDNVFDDMYTPPATVGLYRGVYSASSDKEFSNDNDTKVFNFEITEDYFASLPGDSEFGNILGNVFWLNNPLDGGPGEIPYYSAAHAFYVPNGEGFKVSAIRFGLNNADVQGTVRVELYAFLDEGGSIDGDERELVGFGTVDFLGGPARFVEVTELEGSFSDDIQLADDTNYLIVLSTSPGNPGGDQLDFLGIDTDNLDPILHQFDQFATDFALGFLDTDRHSTTYGGIGSSPDPADIGTRSLNQLTGKVLYVEMGIAIIPSGTEDLNNDLDVSFFPNPITDYTIMNVSLDNPSDVRLEIYSLDGRLIKAHDYASFSANAVSVDMTDVASGAYMAKVITEEGFTTKRIVVQK